MIFQEERRKTRAQVRSGSLAAGPLEPLPGTRNEQLVAVPFYLFAGTELQSADLPKKAPILKLVNGKFVAVRIRNGNGTHETQHSAPTWRMIRRMKFNPI